MQKFSKEELQPQAEKFMKAHGVDSFLATEDGNFFHPKDKCLAEDHNYKNVKGDVIEFSIDNGEVKVENETSANVAQAIDEKAEEVTVPAHINEDVERHGEPVPEPKPKAAAKPKAAKAPKAGK